MKILNTSLALLTSLLAFGRVTAQFRQLTRENFNNVISEEKVIMVEFFAPWCGVCQAFEPHYEAAAKDLKLQDIPLAKVNCDEEEELCNEYDIGGFPTLKVFKNGHEEAEYQGPLDQAGVVGYMKRQSLPTISELSVETVSGFEDVDSVVIVGFLDEQESRRILSEVAEELHEDYVFGVAPVEAAAKFNLEAPSIVIFKNFEESPEDSREVLTGHFTQEQLEQFIENGVQPIVEELTPTNAGSPSDLPIAYLFINNEAQKKELVPELKRLAREYKGKMVFVWADVSKHEDEIFEILALKNIFPAFAIQNPINSLKYPLDQSSPFTLDAVREHLKSFIQGELKHTIRSQPVPEKNEGPVAVVVGSSFEAFVNDPTKDVFIEFYAPWCGYCKKLAPIWEQLGEVIQKGDNKNIVVAKIDATANDLPESAEVYGYPMMKLYKATEKPGEKVVLDYEGKRTLRDLVSFLKEHATNKVEIIGELPAEIEEEWAEEGEEDSEEAHGSEEEDENEADTTEKGASQSEVGHGERRHDEL
ncbi:uncharacterized protein VTP21DRAFT_10649 [Calcarisporiella thermophila]|uniref:uncharacterized protein n=1 Tax=Calcarisporiella thermophila TaxID=911321 RepID=UPI003742E1BA